ncbi:MAG: Glycerate 2-kinase [Candidatus Collierbacteria bacterium GW2011_GWC2_44_18]|uniref:Glycerate 2-kinase n=2 Tax=Microgenomates group TaxID=1794810 RepID=A0A0G1M6B6_9BACT|nr:MAG: Glycerate 2-kinase [Microgenomates group bacterium GW2011_GWC1_44_10]KKT49259.1 MAG: Glycerate 2-kinase [Candidatus Collierbacteria bacterium GW2011_GWC2_44_18]KKT67464.1 MAG: Glycerate 2-kinase [Candidatus Woesebacteria bacterium GW2011_GWA2_44_33]
MSLIKNYSSLATSDRRKTALKILEAGLAAIQPEKVLQEQIHLKDGVLRVANKRIKLSKFERVFLIGFGKGSAEVSSSMESRLGDSLTKGWVIDTVAKKFKKIFFTLGTHPLPSEENVAFTEKVLRETAGMTKKDLVLVVVCGGGSALFEAPYSLPMGKLREVSAKLINSGATISEINVVRKHLSKVKGGGLAKHLFPARIVNLIFSDVPGNDLAVIASGPTVRDGSTIKKALSILDKYEISRSDIPESSLTELPKEAEYFENVDEVIVLSNMTALEAMNMEAKNLGFKSFIFSDKIQGDTRIMGRKLIEQTPPGKILLAGGETTIKVVGKGKGGRNQALVLASLPIEDDTLVLSFDSDGIDFYHFGGAMADKKTGVKAKELNIDAQEFLKNDDSAGFFEKVGDGILTDKLGSNVTDLMMILKI